MKRTLVILVIAMGCLISACCAIPTMSTRTVQGSGQVTSEIRDLSEFTSIVLEASADVDVKIEQQPAAVIVQAEDNILPLIETQVRLGQLVIRFKPGARISNTRPIHTSVTTKRLDGIRLVGSGNIRASGLGGNKLDIDLPGSGNITAAGAVDKVKITMKGSGEITCGELQANAATVRLPGSGNVTVYVSDSLDATVSGSGNIRYSGHPAKVRQSVNGSGHIGP